MVHGHPLSLSVWVAWPPPPPQQDYRYIATCTQINGHSSLLSGINRGSPLVLPDSTLSPPVTTSILILPLIPHSHFFSLSSSNEVLFIHAVHIYGTHCLTNSLHNNYIMKSFCSIFPVKYSTVTQLNSMCNKIHTAFSQKNWLWEFTLMFIKKGGWIVKNVG